MAIHAYPGQGLSLSQLVFALNEELKRVAYCSSFTFNAVSQLDHDTSTALATIREWRNSFVPINRVPSEVLSLIPTHLSFEKDLYSASSVCRHWRRTFIQHAALWSQLNLPRKRSDLVKILLERAKGSTLDVRSTYLDCTNILALVSPHAQRFRSLDFVFNYWPNIQKFSEAISGPLPLLRTLEINATGTMDPPLLPLFSGAVNLKNFSLHSEGIPFLNHFTFPNLTTFEFSAVGGEFPISQLLNFLEALPTLRTVRVKIGAQVLRGDVPPERVIVLPNVEILSVTERNPGYGIAPHISCPSARRMALVREQDVDDPMPEEIFPAWNTVAPQYMASTIDEVALGITTPGDDFVSFSLSLSSGSATLELGYGIIMEDEDCDEPVFSYEWKYAEVFDHALEAIRTHPLLNNIKRLRIWDKFHFPHPHRLPSIAKEATGLFEFVGPLEELVLDIEDLQLFLSPFSDLPAKSQVPMEQSTFPSIKGLIIAKQLEDPFDEKCVATIVGFVRSQHMRGVPFERVAFHMKCPPAGMAERLKPWVGTNVHFSEETISGDDRGVM